MAENLISVINEWKKNSNDWENEQTIKSSEPIYLHGRINGEHRGSLGGHIIIERDVVGDVFQEKRRYAELNSVSVYPHPIWRQKGLGSAMVKEFEEYARRYRASKIVGEIGPSDYKEEPWLPDFYRKLGFELTKKG